MGTRHLRHLLVALALAVLAAGQAARAADVALVVTQTEDVGMLARGSLERSHDTLVERLLSQGYVVYSTRNGDRQTILDLFEQTETALEQGPGRLLLQFVGDAVSVNGRTGLLPAGAEVTSPMQADTRTVPLVALLDLAARRPAQNLVVLGIDTGDAPADFAEQPARFDIPQGVTVLRGAPRGVMVAVSDQLIGGGRTLSSVDTRTTETRFEGLVLGEQSFAGTPAAAVPAPDGETVLAEDALWIFAESGESAAALELYLQRYPNGKYASEARRRLAALTPARPATAEEIENELGLSREARRAIQQNLSVLGFDTRGVDGIFGPGTRSAIRAWQRSASSEATGFLDTEQIETLSREAEIRATALRAEQERVARERRLADEAYWRQTGSSGREADLRDYLRQYPQGLHASTARRALQDMRDQAEQASREAERAAFDEARRADNVGAYRRFLRSFPDGALAGEARERIAALRDNSATEEEIARYRDRERALGLTVASAMIIETRLRTLGLDPGRIDGKIDRDTRRAISRFQGSQNMTVTGYLDPITIQRLIFATRG